MCFCQLENTIKDANDDLAKVLKWNFKREGNLSSPAIIQVMYLDYK